MKTAISLPDSLFEQAELVASRLKVTRSELYARALQKFLATQDPDPVTEKLNEFADEINAEAAGTSDFRRAVGRTLIEKGHWEW